MGADGQLILQIGVTGAGAIPAAMEEARQAVQQSTTEMQVGFQQAGTSSQAAAAKMEYSMTEARHAIRGAGEEIGVSMPRFVSSFVSSLPVVGPALAAAFSTIAIIGLIQVLAQVPGAIEKIIGKLSDWDDAAKKTYEDQIRLNRTIVEENLAAADQQRRTNEIGLQGTAKFAQEQQNLAAHLKEVAAQAAVDQRTINQLQATIAKFKGVAIFTHPDDREAFNDALRDLPIITEELAKLQAEMRAGPGQKLQLGAEGREEAKKAEAERIAAADKLAQKIKAFDDKILQIKVAHARETERIQREWSDQLADDQQRDVEAAIKTAHQRIEVANEEADAVAAAANRALQRITDDDNASLKSGQMTAQQWKQSQIEAIEGWAAVQRQELLRSLALVKQVYGQEEVEYKRLMHQLDALDDERRNREAKVDHQIAAQKSKVLDEINRQLTTHTKQILEGQETFGQAMGRIYSDMVEGIIAAIEKMLVQMAVQFVLQHILHKAAATADVFTDAGRGAAAGFASVMEALPFPVNVAVAPPVAAATFAQIAAYSAFEGGGIVPTTDMALLHKNEMVLPAGLSAMFQGMVNQGGAQHTTHIHYNPTTYGGGGAGFREMLKQHSAELTRIIRRQQRRGALPSP